MTSPIIQQLTDISKKALKSSDNDLRKMEGSCFNLP
jgi:hypothetical protein